MKNTQKELFSTKCTPIVLTQFAELLPPLSQEQFKALESDILKNGCYAPIIVNDNLVVIDGHHRLKICKRHGLPYRMTVFSFADDLEAKQWALDTQKSRRSLDKWELGQIALKLKPEIEAKARQNRGQRNDLCMKSDEGFTPVDTRQALADSVGISRDTMSKVMKIAAFAPDSVKDALDHKEISINRGYALTKEPDEFTLARERKADAEYTAIRQELINMFPSRSSPEETDRQQAIRAYMKAFEYASLMHVTDEYTAAWVERSGIRYDHLDRRIKEARTIAHNFERIADFMEYILKPNHRRTKNRPGLVKNGNE